VSTALPPAAHDRATTRRALDVDDASALVAFVGSVRPYKGVPDLIAATRSLRPGELHLVIAGEMRDPDVARHRDDAGVTVIDRVLSDPEFVGLVAAADLVVLPFKSITHSASLLTVAGLGAPVLAPRIGALPEAAESMRSVIRLYDPPLDATTIRDALRWAEGLARTPMTSIPGHDWDEIATRTSDLYASARSRSAGRRR
jgi:glycosyltransferase involved in cell wall biosynthesis